MKTREKTGGRTKGVPNKKTQELHEIAEELGCNPFMVLLHFAKGDFEALGYDEHQSMVTKSGEVVMVLTIPPELRQKSAKDACEYLHPKRKAVEHSGSIDGNKIVTIEDYIRNEAKKK